MTLDNEARHMLAVLGRKVAESEATAPAMAEPLREASPMTTQTV